MSKTLKKESGQLRFDTSLNNLKCFIRPQSRQKNADNEPTGRNGRRRTQDKCDRRKKIEFQDKDFLSSVVCKVLNDVNAQEITQLLDNMNFPTSGSSDKDRSREAPEEIEHLQMKQIFKDRDTAQPQQPLPQPQLHSSTEANSQALYYLPHPVATQALATPEKYECHSTFQSSFSDSFSLSPEEQTTYEQYPSYGYAYVYYQNSSSYRVAAKKRKNNSSEESSEYRICAERMQLDGRTTLMIRHIPNKYTEDMLFDELSKNYRNKVNFLYLPIDQYNQCNVGYAFVNFIHTKFIPDFYYEFNGRRWDKFNSEKRCELAYARIQGTNSLINHFENGLTSIKARKEERRGKSPDPIDHQLPTDPLPSFNFA